MDVFACQLEGCAVLKLSAQPCHILTHVILIQPFDMQRELWKSKTSYSQAIGLLGLVRAGYCKPRPMLRSPSQT